MLIHQTNNDTDKKHLEKQISNVDKTYMMLLV